MANPTDRYLSNIDDVIAEILDDAVEEFQNKLGINLAAVEHLPGHTLVLHFKEGLVIKVDIRASLK
jgi:hypothetical protein